MRVQLASDLHLEAWPRVTFEETLKPAAPVLVLLGDICQVSPKNRMFFEWCSERWDTVVWIPGVEEIWGSGFTAVEKGVEAMRQLVMPYVNIHVLYNERMKTEDGALILGTPLWWRPAKGMLRVKGNVWAEADPPPCKEEAFLREHAVCLRWLTEQLKSMEMPVVVFSHAAPLAYLQQEEWIQDRSTVPVAVELQRLVKIPVLAWAYGHSHVSNQEYVASHRATGEEDSVLLVCNPRGVPDRASGYQKNFVIRVAPQALSEESVQSL
jgi:hypothetical protein